MNLFCIHVSLFSPEGKTLNAGEIHLIVDSRNFLRDLMGRGYLHRIIREHLIPRYYLQY